MSYSQHVNATNQTVFKIVYSSGVPQSAPVAGAVVAPENYFVEAEVTMFDATGATWAVQWGKILPNNPAATPVVAPVTPVVAPVTPVVAPGI